MSKFQCTKCQSINLHIEEKGNNTGLYCNDCGKWIKWLNKDEERAFNYSNKNSNEDVYEKVIAGIKAKKQELEIFLKEKDINGETALIAYNIAIEVVERIKKEEEKTYAANSSI